MLRKTLKENKNTCKFLILGKTLKVVHSKSKHHLTPPWVMHLLLGNLTQLGHPWKDLQSKASCWFKSLHKHNWVGAIREWIWSFSLVKKEDLDTMFIHAC